MTGLKDRLDTLNAKADKVKRWQCQQDRQDALKESMHNDPVTAQMAR